ncbi:T9SS type A sorting domain-containing protein [bacterium]|nr:T9SS type A sorting domain-containing protein [bacterium]
MGTGLRDEVLLYDEGRMQINFNIVVLNRQFAYAVGRLLMLSIIVGSAAFAQNRGTGYAPSAMPDIPKHHIELYDEVVHGEHPGFARWFCKLGDVNDDGYDDFAVSASLDTTFIFFGGDPLDHDPAIILPGGSTGLASGDFNGDGRIDIATGVGWRDKVYNADYRGRVRLFFRHPNPPYFNFEPDMELRGPDSSGWGCFDFEDEQRSAIQTLDFNGDGYTDLLFKVLDTSLPSRAKLVLLYGGKLLDDQADLEFYARKRGIGFHAIAHTMMTGDLDGNGCDDILCYGFYDATEQRTAEYWDYYPGNNADLTGIGRTLHADSGWSPSKFFSHIMDIDLDGYDDIIDQAVRTSYGDVLVFHGSAQLPQHPVPDDSIPNYRPEFGGDIRPRVICPVGDMNGDGTRDILIGWATYFISLGTLYYLYPMTPWGLVREPIGYFGTIPDEDWVEPGAHDAGDVNGDGYDDVITLGRGGGVENKADHRFQIYLGSSDMLTDVETPFVPSRDAFQIYPNPVPPSTRQLTIGLKDSGSGPATILLRNILGQTVLRKDIEISKPDPLIQISFPELRAGYYHVSVAHGDRIEGRGIIVR